MFNAIPDVAPDEKEIVRLCVLTFITHDHVGHMGLGDVLVIYLIIKLCIVFYCSRII